jgi:hypothetical protein
MKGCIYCIKSLNDNNIYIGSTIQPINVRYSKHKYDSKHSHRIKPVHKMILDTGGFDNYEIKTLKELSCNTIIELREYEKKIINDYRDNDIYKIMNSK